jgi:hypothetical protein
VAYLRDPPWTSTVTSGLRGWEEDPSGTRFRWTTGRASFFVPSDAGSMTLPMRAVFPGINGRPTTVQISVDGRWLADVDLPNPDLWVRPSLPLPRGTSRRYRRVDLRVNRVVGFPLLGVETGVIETAPR